MTITFNEIMEFDRRVFRNIQGKIDFDEFDDLTTNPQAKAYAHRAADNASLKLSSHEIHYHAIDFIFSQKTWLASRFSNGTYPVWYGSVDLNTSFYETSHHWQKTFLDAPQGFSQTVGQSIKINRSVFTVACKAALIDLRNKMNAPLKHSDTSDYSHTQEIGYRVYQEGYPGLLIKSARVASGENVAVFQKKILTAPEYYRDFIYEYDIRNRKVLIKIRDSNEVVLEI